MKYGPPEIGETVDTITGHVRWRGTLLARKGDLASIGVLGRFEPLVVPFDSCQPIRETLADRERSI